MKNSTLLIVGAVAVGLALYLFRRSQRSNAMDPKAQTSPMDVLRDGVAAGVRLFTSSPKEDIDSSSRQNPAPTGLGADYTEPVISLRASALTYADYATIGVYPE